MNTEIISYNALLKNQYSIRLPKFRDSVIFFDVNSTIKSDLSNCIKNNDYWFKNKFEKAHFNLINTTEIKISDEIHNKIRYIFPSLTDRKLNAIKNHFKDDFKYYNASQYLLNHLGYEGNVKSGFLIIDSEESIISIHECLTVQDLFNFTYNYIGDYFYRWEYRGYSEPDYMIPDSSYQEEPIDNIDLSEDSKEAIHEILQGISRIDKNGDLLKILPFIDKYLSVCKKNYLDSISHLCINENFDIVLTGYDITIKLSPLTMAVYLVFLNNPKGILPNDLHYYKNELLNYYTQISDRVDYNKILKSVEDIIDPSNNALYVHFSRIKSAFIKHIHPDLAINYYIIGKKNQPKYIKLNREVVAFISN